MNGADKSYSLMFCLFLTLSMFSLAMFAPLNVNQAMASKYETIPSEYLAALRAANNFLEAWVSRDFQKGIALLSKTLRKEINDDALIEDYIVGLSNPHHAAFEIGTGKSTRTDRYVFPVVLYEEYTGEKMGFKYSGEIEVAKEGNNWRISKLPRSSEMQE